MIVAIMIAMDASPSNERIDLGQVVASAYREKIFVTWALRLALGFLIALIVSILTLDYLGPWSLIPAVVVGAAATWRANARRMLQMGAEYLRDPSLPVSFTLSNTESVDAINVRPGDWACRQRRAATKQVKSIDGTENKPPTEDKAMILKWVIATTASRDERDLVLRFSDGDVERPQAKNQYYRFRPKRMAISSESVQEAARVLGDLLSLLVAGSAPELDLARSLTNYYSEPSVHRALRAGLSKKLIEQDNGLGKFFLELCAVFSRRIDERLRRNCLVGMSPAGEVWIKSSGMPLSKEGKPGFGSRAGARYSAESLAFRPVGSGQSTNTADTSNDQPRESETENQTVRSPRKNSDGPAIMLSTAICGGGAGLAALLNRQIIWERIIFVLLVSLAGCAFLALICSGLLYMAMWWRAGRRTSNQDDTPAKPKHD
jgi:hypothetical protein